MCDRTPVKRSYRQDLTVCEQEFTAGLTSLPYKPQAISFGHNGKNEEDPILVHQASRATKIVSYARSTAYLQQQSYSVELHEVLNGLPIFDCRSTTAGNGIGQIQHEF